MFRKRRRPTSHFKIPPPYNPIEGEQADLRQNGTSPFCVMMQIAAEDTYENHVVCRGFDPRILKFIDYAAGNPNKPGISVAKPFGKRIVGTYEIGEVYPAFLPTQGNANFIDFRQTTYIPPSPANVLWRVGQNPGVVTFGALEGGQPESLENEIEILYDHNGKVINWLLIGYPERTRPQAATIEYVIESLDQALTGPYRGLVIATVKIKGASCGLESLIGTTADVVDHSGCIFDEPDMLNYTGWAFEGVYASLAEGALCTDLTPCHWAAFNRCCGPGSGTYADPCYGV